MTFQRRPRIKISQAGLLLLQDFEGFRPKAYEDVAGIWTIGYGTTVVNGVPVKSNMRCTQEQAVKWLVDQDLAPIERNLSALFPNLRQPEFDALCCLIYNIGYVGFKGSTLCKALREGKPIEQDYFTRWSKAKVNGELTVVPGLLKRRNAEWRLFNSGRTV